MSSRSCYDPSNATQPNDHPCNSDADVSVCCNVEDECTSNGLCKYRGDSNNNWLWRGTCTDPTWESDTCPHYCLNITQANAIITACSEDTYCCAYDNIVQQSAAVPNFDCCTDAARLFSAGAAVHSAGVTVLTNAFVGFTRFGTLETATASTTGSSATSASTVPISATSASPTSSGTTSSSLTKGAIAGISIGVIIGIALCILLGIHLGHRRTKYNQAASGAPPAQAQHPAEEFTRLSCL
ncbi:hypothetical protein B0A48_05260 [Cryoendolithus antarcticus]|uniref:Mid2 domain-containing protein n=1 Tax=Cryoendolithus antarcticus TaxID=1507870 RepID=A0A1V8TI00_9PEZI|nr:hypothetical protein B0A48_05260 [Cryoendolithus antarcticus]